MEFLVAGGFSIDRIVKSLREGSIGWIGKQDHCRDIGPLSVFATDPGELNAPQASSDTPESERFTIFDGQFSRGARFFHPLLPDTSEGLPQQIDELLDGDGSGLSINAGVFVAGRLDGRGLTLVTDPLSQYPVYYFRAGERFLVSNVLRYITIAMRAHGFSATPSLLPCVESLVFGGALADSTPIEEIRRLPFGQFAVARPPLDFHPMSAIEVPLPYEEIVPLAHAALSRHVLAVAEATGSARRVVADVTGGGASRLALSLLLDSPFRDEFAGRCTTRYPDPDANVAGALYSKYDLHGRPDAGGCRRGPANLAGTQNAARHRSQRRFRRGEHRKPEARSPRWRSRISFTSPGVSARSAVRRDRPIFSRIPSTPASRSRRSSISGSAVRNRTA